MKKVLLILSVFIFLSCETTDNSINNSQNNMHGNSMTDEYEFLMPPINYNSKKDKMLIFTGSDWDEYSKLAIDNIFTKDFFVKYTQDFDIYNIDVVRDKTLLPQKALEQNYKYFAEYEISEAPALVLETQNGDVYGLGCFQDHCDKLENFDAFLQEKLEARDAILQLAKNVKDTTGAEHTKAIDEFLKNVKLPYSSRYHSLIFDALESDPENQTGLRKIYLLRATRLRALIHMSKSDARSASDEFLKIADDEIFAPLEKQACYYEAAYLLASQVENTEEVLTLLNKALEISSESELAPKIKSAIYSVSKRLQN